MSKETVTVLQELLAEIEKLKDVERRNADEARDEDSRLYYANRYNSIDRVTLLISQRLSK